MAQFNLVEAFDPEYTSDLEQLPMEALRAKRDACAQLETDLSYLRRLAQARIDLILAESQRRHGNVAGGELGNEDLVQRLPQILSDHGRHDGPGRLSALLAPAEGDQTRLAARVEEVLPSDKLGSLDEVGAAHLDDLLRELSELERRVSAERRSLHDIQDRLQEELVRRYRSGEATVDALLR